MRIEHFLDQLASDTLERTSGVRAPALLRAANPEHGDYQVNAAMALAKRLGKKPRDIAEPLAAALSETEPISRAEVAGPGFVNLTLAPAFIAAELTRQTEDLERDGVDKVEAPESIVIDFSSPNIAKQMHVGHLRSTIIGDALQHLLRFVGHKVVSDNHLGDWGTLFGLLIVGVRETKVDLLASDAPLQELEGIYKRASKRAEADPGFADAARAELAKLQAGDAENRALWEQFVGITKRELNVLYERLGVRFDVWLGESFYHPMLADVVQSLLDKGLAREDQGAIGVFWKELSQAPKSTKNIEAPFLVRKSDGAYMYPTTDIATALYRHKEYAAGRSLYVVDARQKPHFVQVFAMAELLGIPTKLEHVSFGTILGEDGTPMKTRDAEGNTIPLTALLDEAEQRAEQRIREGIAERGMKIPEEDIASVARVVGIGAVKYADLRQNRASDYQFDLDKMVDFNGRAGPYLQYAYARCRSIFAQGGEDMDSARGPIQLQEPAELELGRVLLRFGEVVHQAAESALPHLLCDHLYDVAKSFSSFYAACPVLKADDGRERQSRLALCGLTARQLRRGLSLLGIDVVERM